LAKIGLAIAAQAFAARLAEANCFTIPVVKALHPTSKAELVFRCTPATWPVSSTPYSLSRIPPFFAGHDKWEKKRYTLLPIVRRRRPAEQ
jgi:hypothetical protein